MLSIYDLPDMSNIYRTSFLIDWMSRRYTITLTNNTRTENIAIDISTIDDGGNEVYILKSALLSQYIDIMSLVYSELWDGRIYIYEKNSQDILITPYNLATNFSLLLITEDEFE